MKAINALIISIFTIFSIANVNAGYYYNGYYVEDSQNYNYYNDSYYNNNCYYNTDNNQNSYNSFYSNGTLYTYIYNNKNYNYENCYYSDDYNINRNTSSQNAYRNSYINNNSNRNISLRNGNSYYGDSYYRNYDDTNYEEPRDDYYTESEVEETLNYFPGIVDFDLGLEELEIVHFKSNKTQDTFNDFYSQDAKMRALIVKLYQNGELTQYEVNGIVINYKNFIYYTNQYFYYTSLQDKNPKLKKDTEINDMLLKNYKNSQASFQKVKAVVLNR